MLGVIFAAVPGIAWIGLFFLYLDHDRCWRRSLLSASIAWGTILALMTEGLSLISAIRFDAVLALWLLVCLIVWGLGWKAHRRRFEYLRNSRWSWPKLTPFQWMAIASISLIAAITGFLAIVSAPNIADSMTDLSHDPGCELDAEPKCPSLSNSHVTAVGSVSGC